MTSSYLNEMHDVICVNLYRTKSYLNPQRKGVTGASPTTAMAYLNLREGGYIHRIDSPSFGL